MKSVVDEQKPGSPEVEAISGASGTNAKMNDEAPEDRLMCRKCGTMTAQRRRRIGWLEEMILPRFGVFPWECMRCRKSQYLRNRGAARRRRSKEPGE